MLLLARGGVWGEKCLLGKGGLWAEPYLCRQSAPGRLGGAGCQSLVDRGACRTMPLVSPAMYVEIGGTV